jgi:hypothetical protein
MEVLRPEASSCRKAEEAHSIWEAHQLAKRVLVAKAGRGEGRYRPEIVTLRIPEVSALILLRVSCIHTCLM